MFSDLVNLIGKLLDFSDKDKPDEYTNKAGDMLLGRQNSIAKMAKQAVLEYPVIISTGLSDDSANALKITKQVELFYAYFYSLAAGLNPTVGANNTIAGHLGKFGGESVNFIPIKTSEENLDKIKTLYYRNCIEGCYDFTEYKSAKDYLGLEASSSSNRHRNRGNSNNSGAPQHHLPAGGSVMDYRGQSRIASQNIDERVRMDDNLKKALGKRLPTTITLKLYAGRHEIDVTIAVKAVPHFINQEEIDALFDSILEDSQQLLRLIKLSTGEISFIKDFCLQMDRIQRDKRLYASLGKHPLYRELMSRKNWSIVQCIANINKSLRELIAGKSEILPTFTIITTMDEITKALKMTPRKILDNPKKIYDLMKHLMLLGFVIYDITADIIYFYFSSFDKPWIMKTKELKDKETKTEDAMIELIKAMNGMLR